MMQELLIRRERRDCGTAKRIFLAVLVALLFIGMPLESMAASCTTPWASLDDTTTGASTSKQCNTASTGVLAQIVCLFSKTINFAQEELYCGFKDKIKDPLTALMTTFILIFGVSVFTGHVRLTYREVSVVLLKLAFVFVMISNADYAIGMVGRLSVGILQQGSDIALKPMGGNVSVTQPDSVIAGMFNFMSDADIAKLANTNNCGTASAPVKCMNETVLKIFSQCATTLAVLGLSLILFMPVVLIFLGVLLLQYFKLYFFAFLNYLTALVVLGFLLALSPLFISFFLFKVTAPLFERWVQFLTSYSLQTVILFTFLALLGVITQSFTLFLYGLIALLRPYDVTLNVMLMTVPIPNACSICEYKVTTDTSGYKVISCQPAVQSSTYSNPDLRVVMPEQFGATQIVDDQGLKATPPTLTDVSGAAIDYKLKLGSVLSNFTNTLPEDPTQDGGNNYVIPLQNLIKEADFLLYLVANVIAFWTIARILQEFIQEAPQLARALSGVMPSGMGGKLSYETGINYPHFDTTKVGPEVFRKFRENPLISGNTDYLRKVGAGLLGIGGVVAARSAVKNSPFAGSAFGAFISGGPDGDAGVRAREEEDKRKKQAEKQVDEAAKELQAARDLNLAREQDVKRAQQELEAIKLEVQQGKADGIQQARAAAKLQKAKEQAAFTTDLASRRKYLLDRKQEELAEMQKASATIALPRTGGGTQGGAAGNVGARAAAGAMAAGATLAQLKAERDGKKKEQAQKRQALGANAQSSLALPVNARAAAVDQMSLVEAQEYASATVYDLETKLGTYGALLNEKDKDAYRSTLDRAKRDLGQARTAKDVHAALASLKSMDVGMASVSGQGMMEDAVKAGAASAGMYLEAAAATIPAAYLKQTRQELAKVNEEVKKSKDDKQLAEVAGKIDVLPAMMLNASLDSAENQMATASRIVSEDKLWALNGKLKDIEEQARKTTNSSQDTQLLKSMRSTPEMIVAATIDGLSNQHDIAAGLVPAQFVQASAKAIDDAKEKLKNAKTGDDYNAILNQLVAAPAAMLDGVTAGLREKASHISADAGPEEREAIKKALDQATLAIRSARSGNDFDKILSNLTDVSAQLEDLREEGKLAGAAAETITFTGQGGMRQLFEQSQKTSASAGSVAAPGGGSLWERIKSSVNVRSSGVDLSRGPGGVWEDIKKTAQTIVEPVADAKPSLSVDGVNKGSLADNLQNFNLRDSVSQSWQKTKEKASSLVEPLASANPHVTSSGRLDFSRGISGAWDDIKRNLSMSGTGPLSASDAKLTSSGVDLSRGPSGLWDDIKATATQVVSPITEGKATIQEDGRRSISLSALSERILGRQPQSASAAPAAALPASYPVSPTSNPTPEPTVPPAYTAIPASATMPTAPGEKTYALLMRNGELVSEEVTESNTGTASASGTASPSPALSATAGAPAASSASATTTMSSKSAVKGSSAGTSRKENDSTDEDDDSQRGLGQEASSKAIPASATFGSGSPSLTNMRAASSSFSGTPATQSEASRHKEDSARDAEERMRQKVEASLSPAAAIVAKAEREESEEKQQSAPQRTQSLPPRIDPLVRSAEWRSLSLEQKKERLQAEADKAKQDAETLGARMSMSQRQALASRQVIGDEAIAGANTEAELKDAIDYLRDTENQSGNGRMSVLPSQVQAALEAQKRETEDKDEAYLDARRQKVLNKLESELHKVGRDGPGRANFNDALSSLDTAKNTATSPVPATASGTSAQSAASSPQRRKAGQGGTASATTSRLAPAAGAGDIPFMPRIDTLTKAPDWEKLSPEEKKARLEQAAETSKKEQEKYLFGMTDLERKEMEQKQKQAMNRLVKARTNAEVEDAAGHMRDAEALLSHNAPMLLSRQAHIAIANLERGLAAAGDTLEHGHGHRIRAVLEAARRDIQSAQSAQDFSAIISRLEDAQKLVGHHH